MKSKATLSLAAMSLVIMSVTAHLEINLVAGPSVKLSVMDATRGGSDKNTILCRTALIAGTQEGRDPNDPKVGDVCHGHSMLNDPKRLATLTAGGEFAWGIPEDKLGSGHDGGHCSWWVSDGTEQKTWYKFFDDIDCTANITAGDQPGKIKIPKNLPLSCKTACTLMWLWSPLHAGKCEIYSNCFDVKINGVTGGIKDDYPTKTAPFDCKVVHPVTHKTSSFGRFINRKSDGTVTMEKVTDGDQFCFAYTVTPGAKIDDVVAMLDISKEDLYKYNKKTMPDENTLPAAGTKMAIFEKCMDDKFRPWERVKPAVSGTWSPYLSMLAILATLLSLF